MNVKKRVARAMLVFGVVGGAMLAQTSMQAATPRKVVLPEKLKVAAMDGPKGLLLWSGIERRFKSGDPALRQWVARTLRRADRWAARPDAYYVGLFRPETPFGSSTICCPFHPEESGWVPFRWDPDHPWRLTCPRCVKEGRKPAYYPNELYPDEGRGCRPTDEAWRKTHDAAWSKKYKIPWEKWDGHTHGDIDSFAFFFLGYCQKRIFFELTWRRQILSSLSQGYVFASKLYPKDNPRARKAALYAHKAKLILVTMTRAILGDAYLRDVLGQDEKTYRRAVRALARDADGKPLPYREYPGYRERDTISDHSADDPEHPIQTIRIRWWKKALTIYPTHALAEWAGAWLPCYAMIQPSFTPAEREAGLRELVERLLTSKAGDAKRLKAKGRAVKKGVVDLGLHPYAFKMRGNLAGGAALANISLGLMLDNKDILRNVAKAIYDYLHGGYFTTDGLGHETSPHYTQVALSNLAWPLDALNGLKKGFGPGDPFWDPKTKALNPYLDPALERAAYATLLSMLPDGRCAPWTDSWVTERPNLALAERIANVTGRVPERFLPWLDVTKTASGAIRLRLKKSPTLPSYVLPANGLAVMRSGQGSRAAFLSVDWSRATGHSHDGPFNLLFYAAGHEVLNDQGYLNNVTPTNAWMGSAEAHNTALIRTRNGDPNPCVTWRGGLRFFVDTPGVKAVEMAETDQGKLKKMRPSGQPVMYQRTVLLLEIGREGKRPHPFVVDIFRLRGGTIHDYYLHGLGDDFDLEGAKLAPVANQKQSLYDVSGFKYRTNTGARAVTGLRRAKADGALAATWRRMKDWRVRPPAMDEKAALRVRLLGAPGTEVFVGKAPGQRYIDARDVTQRVTVLCVRREAKAFRDVPDAFVTVTDVQRQAAESIKKVERLAVVSGDKAAVGVRIEHRGGVDYVLSTTRDGVATVFSDPKNQRKLSLTGRLGVVRASPGKPAALILLQGKRLAHGSEAVDRDAASPPGGKQ